MNLIPLPAFQDNDLWLLHDGQRALVVDPGDAKPVADDVKGHGLQLVAILVTHHHPDHIGGVEFEGTPAQMLLSLSRLSALPASTRVCCTHEYTLGNLKFAKTVEPGNEELLQYPFLCTGEPAVAQAAREHGGVNPDDEVAVFATVRQWKNEFR
jgi:glyoxylase-like metal-dependent hydrolase (beta-lactamase superfamily II)